MWWAASRSSNFGVSVALGPSSKVIATYGPSTWTELTVILGAAGVAAGGAASGRAGSGDAAGAARPRASGRSDNASSPRKKKRRKNMSEVAAKAGTPVYVAEGLGNARYALASIQS